MTHFAKANIIAWGKNVVDYVFQLLSCANQRYTCDSFNVQTLLTSAWRTKFEHKSSLIRFLVTQDLHLLTAYHQTKTLISRFFLLMPPTKNHVFVKVFIQSVDVTKCSETLLKSLAKVVHSYVLCNLVK